jgi:hypothetical protein
MKPIKTDFNAFEWRFPRSFKEANGYEYESTLESPKEKRQRVWRATKISVGIALSLMAWLTYSLHTL